MDSTWEDFGTIWDVSWPLLGAFGSLLGHSESNFLEALVEDCPQEASGIDLGSILARFGEDFDRFGKGLGKVWARLQQYRINVSSMQGGGRCLREAVSMRGGPPPAC